MRWIAAALLIATGLGLAGCGSAGTETSSDSTASDPGSSSSSSASCKPLTKSQLHQVADGLDKGLSLTDGARLPMPKDERVYGVTRIIAVTIEFEDGETETAILAAGLNEGDLGPILAVDHMAREFFTWGSAAWKGSPMREYQDELLVSDEAQEVEGCL